MTSRFDDWYGTAIADGRPQGASRYLDAYGLATVDTDVSISLVIRHPAVEQLRVFLTNPAGAEALVYDGSQTGRDLVLADAPAYFSGDESVNGRWTLRVEDKKRGQVGSLERWSLRIGSRWD